MLNSPVTGSEYGLFSERPNSPNSGWTPSDFHHVHPTKTWASCPNRKDLEGTSRHGQVATSPGNPTAHRASLSRCIEARTCPQDGMLRGVEHSKWVLMSVRIFFLGFRDKGADQVNLQSPTSRTHPPNQQQQQYPADMLLRIYKIDMQGQTLLQAGKEPHLSLGWAR